MGGGKDVATDEKKGERKSGKKEKKEKKGKKEPKGDNAEAAGDLDAQHGAKERPGAAAEGKEPKKVVRLPPGCPDPALDLANAAKPDDIDEVMADIAQTHADYLADHKKGGDSGGKGGKSSAKADKKDQDKVFYLRKTKDRLQREKEDAKDAKRKQSEAEKARKKWQANLKKGKGRSGFRGFSSNQQSDNASLVTI